MDWNNLQLYVNLFLQELGVWLRLPMQAFSFLGTEEFFLFIMPALYWCVSPPLGIRAAMGLLLGSSLNAGLKILFHLPRPYWIDIRVQALSSESTFGLPSNHAQNAVIIWGLLGKASRNTTLRIIAVLLMILIGVSRLYLGVHFLGDVIAGWTIGALVLLLFIRLDRPVSAWIARQSLAALLICAAASSLVIVLLVLLPGLALQSWPVPQTWQENAIAAYPLEPIDPLNLEGAFSLGGTWLGMMAGAALLFRKSGGFDTAGTPLQLFLRYLIGLGGVLLLWFGLGQLLPRSTDIAGNLLRFTRYVLIGSWISLAAPYIFRHLRLSR